MSNQMEKRKEERQPEGLLTFIKPLDKKECEEEISLAIDRSDTGVALITRIPLPISTPVEIRAGDDFVATGEITDWNWDPQTDTVRLGLRLLDKHGHWPHE
jgi:hypothetical protein